ncbi:MULTISPECIES: hypothetical protein [Acidiphilium]|jgi:hypothetical protein|nr:MULTISPECIES: hypothetical protein [Acidiphilium]MBU6356370.1 hypothetical protein [Rhodospirillales bacterium]MBS3024016.1 hypothetical protein [Acidiphilium multivorum]UNC14785.1 hypothetical protein FE249_11375 [Acidiphilium multivorum]BAJ79441.1 hypothetical protein ACMV_00940 [Acidiphilium multivorum AIU301]GAN72919.1 hypothetical protein Apmu_0037_17 [Acidiphilium multivorum AIU301]
MTIPLSLLLLAASLGAWLGVRAMQQGGVNGGGVFGRLLGPLHGVLGAMGLTALVIALARHPVPARMGLGGFGAGAEILLGLALLLGLFVVIAAWRQRRPAGLLLGTHATLAIAGITLVLAIASLT